jgi:hypothetical protein
MTIIVIPIDDLEYDYFNGYYDLVCSTVEFKELVKYVFTDYLNSNYDIVNVFFPYHEKTIIIELLIEFFVSELSERISSFLPSSLMSYDFVDFVNNGIIIQIYSDPRDKLM